jgi:plasmid stabilization system protein ParE
MVKPPRLPVIWSKSAVQRLQKVWRYIREDSAVNADKVRDSIIQLVEALPENPEKFPLDKFKIDNPGNYRAFETYSYRIAYKVTGKEIRILRVRHVKQEPKKH